MRTRLIENRAVARASVLVLTVGLFVQVGFAVWSTMTTERATARVAAANDLADAWGGLFDHVNLEGDMLHSYLATGDPDQRQMFVQTIGGGAPIFLAVQHASLEDRAEVGPIEAAYCDYAASLRLAAGRPRTGGTSELTHSQQVTEVQLAEQAEQAGAAVRQQISAAMANERVETAAFNRGVNAKSHDLRVAATIAFGICLGLLGLCGTVLLAYQRRVERGAEISRHQALHDSLTGLANRTLLGEQTELTVHAAARYGELAGLLLIDLDRFKEVNDTLGHHAGDLLLQHVATALRGAVRLGDTVARLGGDEFAVLLPRLSAVDEAVEIAQRLVAALQIPVDLDGCTVGIGGSVGVAVYPQHSNDADQLLQHADIAMYTAKRGRSGVSVYCAEENAYQPEQLSLLGELRHALSSRELVVHYQPKAEGRTGRVYGVEALVRWQHPVRGLLSPLEFISLAEQGGLIGELTHYVLGEALDQCGRWQRAGLDLTVAVNVSTHCLVDEELPDKIAEALAVRGLRPDLLTLEITESALISDPQRAMRLLERIRRLGVSLSIDDFGTGYSSMSYLREMPIRELKIDRCFVSRMNSEASDHAIVRAVLDLARNLKMQVVAEGVEDLQTWEELDALGCYASQGFFLSRPLPADELTSWILERTSADDVHRSADNTARRAS